MVSQRATNYYSIQIHTLYSHTRNLLRMSLIEAVSSARMCTKLKTLSRCTKQYTYQFLITHITENWLIKYLTCTDQSPPIIKKSMIKRSRLLCLEHEGKISKTLHPDHDIQINNICNHSSLNPPVTKLPPSLTSLIIFTTTSIVPVIVDVT